MSRVICIAPGDSVAVALEPLRAGEAVTVDGRSLTPLSDIPAGHKLALFDIPAGQPVIKYAAPIGEAARDIQAGEHVHTHNVHTLLNDQKEYAYAPSLPARPPEEKHTFMGYSRADGSAGVRNDLFILPTVGCVNGVARALAAKFSPVCEQAGIKAIALCHPYGCSQMAADQENTRNILADLARHPNAGGVLVLGLGCENSGVHTIKERLADFDSRRVRYLVCQEVEDEIEAGLSLLDELFEQAKAYKREPLDASLLTVGLKCGGSDGLSGITANPVIGAFSDILTASGGTTILTEVPEMFGAEQLLFNRCETPALFSEAVCLINDFKAYYRQSGLPIYENPSPGNKAGGITTLEDKSLGCTQKSGASPVRGVLPYGARVREKGLNLLSAPGNDLVATTALAAAGAQIVLFSTGRGTPFMGPVPTLKISSNAPLANKKRGWIDFDASPVSLGTPVSSVGRALFERVLHIASGEETLSEKAGYFDMAIFKNGVTL